MDLLILLFIWALALALSVAGLRARSAATAMVDVQTEGATCNDRPDRVWAPAVGLSAAAIEGGMKPTSTGKRFQMPKRAYWATPAHRLDAFGLGASGLGKTGFGNRSGQPRLSIAIDAGNGNAVAYAVAKRETNRTSGDRMIPADPSAAP
ncbi:MAG: hypothetical protein AAGJ32_10820 [Pseudomonadota bacterium]